MQSRLNYMALLYARPPEKVDDLDLNAIQHEFVAKNDLRRIKSLGKFAVSDRALPRRLTECFKPISKSLCATTVKQYF